MKKNMFNLMNKLNIDYGIKDLIKQLWKHCYKTDSSCSGHGSIGYISFKSSSGDGWFEKNADRYGLTKVENKACCYKEFEDEVRKYNFDIQRFTDRRKTCGCGAGVNGYSVYRGKLVQPILHFN